MNFSWSLGAVACPFLVARALATGSLGLLLYVLAGCLFLLGLVLSVFRESLLRLPQRVRDREGVFRVLSWR